jgi:hypothetical protein
MKGEAGGGGSFAVLYCPGIYFEISLSEDIYFSLDWLWGKGILLKNIIVIKVQVPLMINPYLGVGN